MLRRSLVVIPGIACAAVVLAACGGSSRPAVLSTAPEPGVAPVPAVTPAGTVIDPHVPDIEGIQVDGSSTYAIAATRDPDRLALLDLATGTVTTIAVPGAARHLELAGPEQVIVPGEDTGTVSVIAIPGGAVVSEVHVPRQPHDATLLPDGVIVDADELADAITASRGDTVLGTIGGVIQPGGVAQADGYAVVVEVRGRLLDVVSGDPFRIVAKVAIGAGPTHVVDLGDGYVAVADTDGDKMLIVRVSATPKVTASIDVPGRPYGLAVDLTRHLLWVASSGTNQLHELTIGAPGSAPREVATFPTIQQPNSLAVVPATGMVVVAGATKAGMLEEITP